MWFGGETNRAKESPAPQSIVRRRGECATLEIKDDGVGLPAGFDSDLGSGMGLTLAKGLAGQILGSFTMRSAGSGTACALGFPVGAEVSR